MTHKIELQAGPELDATVAVEIMEWRKELRDIEFMGIQISDVPYLVFQNKYAVFNPNKEKGKWLGVDSDSHTFWNTHCCFSKSYDAAFEVVEKLRGGKKYKNFIAMETCCNEEQNLFWVCNVVMKDYPNMPITEAADTLPLAICRAALKVVGYEAEV